MRFEILVVCCFLFPLVFSAENNLSETLKNMTQTRNASSAQTSEEGTLKTEIKQYLRECGVDLPGDMYNQDNYNQRYQNNRSSYGYNGNRNYVHRYDYGNNDYANGYQGNDNKNFGNPGEYYNNNGNNAENCNDNRNDRFQGNYGNPYPYNYGQFGSNNNNNENAMYNNMNRHSAHYEQYPNRNVVQHDNCNYDNRDGYDSSNRNGFNYNTGNRGTYDQNYGTRTPNLGGGYGSYGNSNTRYRNGLQGEKQEEEVGKTNLRRRRSSDRATQCASQCVFGYLEVLDENRVPSETLMIKWMQDHLTNDVRRIRALREARRCFARLATTDTSDGCEFSKALASCLDLEIE